jgi:ribose-phosphate pyrophosphokinase
VRLERGCAGQVAVIACTLDHPDEKLLPLLFLADAARELGATAVGLVAPYLAYLRQDRRFREGEAVASRTFAAVLSGHLDWLVTVDPHLHRYSSLAEIYNVPATVVHAAPALADWITANVERPLVVGPDEESRQWVQDVAGRIGAPCVVLAKTRRGDRQVEVSVPDVGGHRDRTPIVIDDIVSSARTMVEAVGQLRAAGLGPPVCIGVHAVLAPGAEQAVLEAGARALVTTTTVRHPTNAIDIASLIVPALRAYVS